MTFLAEASTSLASSLDYRETLERLAKLSVPILGDWCAINTLKEDAIIFEGLAAVHPTFDKAGLIAEVKRSLSRDLSSSKRIGDVVRSGFGCESYLIVPIQSGEKVHGAIAFSFAPGSRYHTPNDLALAEELGRRAGIAVENALLYQAAQKAIQARDEFLSIASHELKTPITSLKLQLQMTRRAIRPDQGTMPTSEKLARVLDISGIQVNRLTALVEDLLDVSRIESGKISFTFETVELRELLEEMVERFSEQAHAAGCSISVLGGGPTLGRCDRFRMEQVILNLLSNAVKYGSGKPIEVRAEIEGSMARIWVRDFGMGIPKDKLEKVFERFERAVSSSNISGLGLGLYIAREIVKAHHGTIQVESELGKGSVFTVEFPVASEDCESSAKEG